MIGIAWSSDREDKFNARATAADELGAGDVSSLFVRSEFPVRSHLHSALSQIGPGGVIPSVDDEEFIVWMRTAGRYRL